MSDTHMNDIYSCEIIRDLLPGYIDGILSESGTAAVCSHLESCSECRDYYETMKEQIGKETELEEHLVLDGFRRINRRTRHLKIAFITVSGLFAALAISVFLVLFVIGKPVPTSVITISDSSYDMEQESLTVTGSLSYTSFHISRVVVEESKHDANTLNILVYETEMLPFLPGKNDFTVTIPNVKGQTVFLACPDYDRMQLFSWKDENYEKLDVLKDQICKRISQLNTERSILSYSEIYTLNGCDGILYHVDYLLGDDASYWRIGDEIVTDGDLAPAGYDVWISIEAPYQIKIYDYQTGAWSEDYSIVSVP